MKTSVIEVRDMLSVLTVDEVEKRIGEVPGVASVTVNYAARNATVRYDETRLEVADIKALIHQRGQQSAGESQAKGVNEDKPAVKPTPEAAPRAPPPSPPPAMAKTGGLDDPSVKNSDEVARALGADLENGLTSQEASRRLAQDGPSSTTPKSFWVIVGLFLIWNLLGVFHYLTSVNATVESLVAQGMTIKQAEVFHNTPSYHYAVFALGVWSGLLGTVFLLLRKAWAVPVFIFSAVMVIVSFVLDAVGGNLSALGASYMGIMTFTLMLALFVAWYSKRMKDHGILR